MKEASMVALRVAMMAATDMKRVAQTALMLAASKVASMAVP